MTVVGIVLYSAFVGTLFGYCAILRLRIKNIERLQTLDLKKWDRQIQINKALLPGDPLNRVEQ